MKMGNVGESRKDNNLFLRSVKSELDFDLNKVSFIAPPPPSRPVVIAVIVFYIHFYVVSGTI